MSKLIQNKVAPLRKQLPCPQCAKPSTRTAYPFCSKRCSDLDLGAWLNGAYAIGAEEYDRSPLDGAGLVEE
ncbi:MAG: DNA gyrase inhibitor YacG [Rhizobiaceae bacterium]